MSWVAVLLLGLLVVLTARQSRRPLSGTTWLLLRSLLPSWRFFEDVEPGPGLLVQVAEAGASYGAWRTALPAPSGRAHLLLNAEGNLRLAYQSLLEQLLAELDGVAVERAVSLTSYRLVQQLAEQHARDLSQAATRYRFRLVSAHAEDEVAFESQEHPL